MEIFSKLTNLLYDKTMSLVSRIVILYKSIIGKDLTLKSINLQSVTFKDTQGKVTKAAEKAQKKK